MLVERASVGSLEMSEQAAAGIQVCLAAAHRLNGKANQVSAGKEACFPARKTESEVGVRFGDGVGRTCRGLVRKKNYFLLRETTLGFVQCGILDLFAGERPIVTLTRQTDVNLRSETGPELMSIKLR